MNLLRFGAFALTAGLLRPAPAAPATLAFGATPVGVTARQTLTLTNPHLRTVRVAVGPVTAPFGGGGHVLLKPRGKATLSFTFTPKAAGLYRHGVQVTRSTGSRETLTLTGTGVAPTPTPVPTPPLASGWFVGPGGSPAAPGTSQAPWDLESTLFGERGVAPGETVWLLPGTYRYPNREAGGIGYHVRLAGTPAGPITLAGVPGARVTIDGGLNVMAGSDYLVVRDLEILVSEPLAAKPLPPEQKPNRPWGGLNVYGGTGCKYINLVIHDNCQGVSFWEGATDSELYGCLIYNNGWQGEDRGHGHALYTQNRLGVKRITDNVFTGGYGFSLHAYGSAAAYVDNYRVEGNVAYSAGPFLLGGARPSLGIQVLSNALYGLDMMVGYTAPYNEDALVVGNVVAEGTLAVNNFKAPVVQGNLVLPPGSTRPPGQTVILKPNREDPTRAHLFVYNWDGLATVLVSLGPFLSAGDRFQLLSPTDFYGPPLLSGTYDGKGVSLPFAGEFAAYVALKDAR